MVKILVVDDHPDTGEAMAKLLRHAGHQATFALNGRDALMQVLQDVPDVVVLDLLMPEMSGPSFLKVVRSYLRLQTLPIVVLSAFTDTQMMDRTPNLNVSAFLAKGSASTSDILRAIEDAIAGHAS